MNRSNCKLKPRHIMIHLDGNEGGGIRSVSEAWYQGFTKRGINVSYLMNRKGKYAKELYDKGNEVHCANVGEVQSVSWNIAGFSMPDVLGWGRSLSSRKIAQPRFEKILQDKCHAEMKIISFITISQPEVIQQILEHLGLYKKSRPPPDKPHASGDVIHELFDDGWPGYEEPFHTVN